MARSPKENLEKILDHDYAVNSGVYSVVAPSVEMKMDQHGEYKPVFTRDLTDDEYGQLLRVDMMSDDSPDESEVAKKLYGGIKDVKYDPTLGYYTRLYAGYVVKGGYRERASSGGMTSWILAELMNQKLIDGAIHVHAVDPETNDGRLFEYTVSSSVSKVQKGAKSRYYPGELSEVLKQVKQNPTKRYAVVGIPEFITELRLLAGVDSQIKKQIVFTIGLICGHQKSAKYVESLAWQHGIRPGDLRSVDFRIKQPHSTAIDYLHQFSGIVNGKNTTFTKTHKELFGGSWAQGFFKSKFSDFTDNPFNEVADVVLGDAWLPIYNSDGMGNNIVIVRNQKIEGMIKNGLKNGDLKLDEVDSVTIKRSQRGLIHHERDELPYRIEKQKKLFAWVPNKRYNVGKISRIRRQVQDVRYQMATTSHAVYQQAVERNDWIQFQSQMTPLVEKYTRLYSIRNAGSARKRKRLTEKQPITTIRSSVRVRTRARALKQKLRIRTRIRALLVNQLRKKRQQAILDKPHGAILTLSGYFNYGNIMQRYALQEFLYSNDYRFVSYERGPLDTELSRQPRFTHTRRFVDQYIVRKQYDKKDHLSCYIVGSDQVWRNWNMSKEKGDLKYYFFDFIKNIKANRIAYAASFGMDRLDDAKITSQVLKQITPLAKKLNAISVRERSAVDIVRKTWSMDAELVLDPSMLLDKDAYSKIIKESQVKLKPIRGMFCYILAVNDNKTKMINKIANLTELKVNKFYPKKFKVLPPVERWLKGFRDSEFIVTDSFHGAAFSIINNTPFIVIENEYGGNTRMTNLLEIFGLEDRLVSEDQCDEFKLSAVKNINWQEVNEKLASLRTHSSNWLIDAVEVSI